MTTKIEGVWSADARFGPSAQSGEILVFKADGNGILDEDAESRAQRVFK